MRVGLASAIKVAAALGNAHPVVHGFLEGEKRAVFFFPSCKGGGSERSGIYINPFFTGTRGLHPGFPQFS